MEVGIPKFMDAGLFAYSILISCKTFQARHGFGGCGLNEIYNNCTSQCGDPECGNSEQ
ncbi:unnamed protein product, partial [Cylicostephanus goldi]